MLALIGLPASLGLALVAWQERGDAERRPVRVGLYENEPKVHTGRDGEPAGLFPALLERIAAVEGWQLEYVPCRWAECLNLLQGGQLDLMPDVALSEARAARLAFHDVPVAQAWSQVYAPLASRLRQLRDLDGRRVAVLGDSVQQAFLTEVARREDVDPDLTAYPDYAAAFRAAAEGRVDAVVTNNFFGRRNAPRHELVETPITFGQSSLYFAAPGSEQAPLLAAIDRHLTAWKGNADSPYYTALRAALTAPPRSALPPWLLPAAAVGSGLLIVLVAAALILRWQVNRRTTALAEARDRLQRLLAASPAILYSVAGRRMQPDWVSANIQRLLGVSPEAACGADWWRQRLHPEDRERAEREHRRILESGHGVQEYRLIDAYGNARHIRDEKQCPPPGEGGAPRVIGTWTDLTPHFEHEEQVRLLTHFDRVTGLANRDRFQQQLDEHLAQAGEPDAPLVVLLDLDRFKSVNESLGMAAGDQLLVAAAERLTALTAPGDGLARIGGDGFAVFTAAADADAAAADLAGRLLDAFHEPLVIAGHSLVLTVSIGIAVYPQDGRSRDALMTGAELALEVSKRAGGNTGRRYDPSLGERSSRRLFLANDLRQAIRNDELVVHYQSQHHIGSGTVAGVEALVRWQRPDGSMVPPDEFIPLAEETGMIQQIDRWVLSEASAQLERWQLAGQATPRVAVNLSASELHDEGLVPFIGALLERHGLPAAALELEITETMLMQQPERAVRVLRRLAALGVQLAMDDFGTGYSNLAHLQRLPLHRLKIDRSLIHDVGLSEHTESIIRAIIALARALDLETVAEGVETEAQHRFLERAGCSVVQGYLYARPVPAPQMTDVTAGRTRRSASS